MRPGTGAPPLARDVSPFKQEVDLSYKIIASQCTVCGACEFECPNAAIRMKGDTYIIDPKKCTECDGESPRCVEVCPVEGTCVKA
jgi:ferredoxin